MPPSDSKPPRPVTVELVGGPRDGARCTAEGDPWHWRFEFPVAVPFTPAAPDATARMPARHVYRPAGRRPDGTFLFRYHGRE